MESAYYIDMNESYNNLSSVLKYLIEKKSVNQTDISKATEIPQGTISRALSKKHGSMKLEHLERLADYFSVSIDQLIGREPIDSDVSTDSINKIDWNLFFKISRPLESKIKRGEYKLTTEQQADILTDLYIKAKSFKDIASPQVINALIEAKLEKFI